ncbi:twin-arginine translocase subunit TatC [Streptomyces ipomoeae]|uniref:Sec-independent protein translocase protein TatC n=2 Tax=Streptomyces ipomoeae TaxID=103232 RepID=L1KQU3_9ACTN|nr:twin-arginine translocase subunit TatC [Streptomyces ipomoeae]EKX62982.1 twin arginine-targeting protein translocase TatC [Streptomyces ipomoeae 91-03]MDX2695288.1 twin-arginine translocase subunit TatC [Streptomyces ipomoeae]MDX2822449.1 twin-arginine translocase subunit TatC [Streptomyces ipomoeae]MDX2839933.1 twin-arginine translocase subunit TatC [Streptomyces ipomoeae]MDX2875749.1 twin-arginine translocase subunit TatC [Streptomyces ipomoeae]
MLKSARKTEKDPEGRMPLAEHLRELRNRLVKSLLAIVVTTVIAALFYKDIIQFFTDPILQAVGCEYSFAELAKNSSETQCARIVQNGLLSPFTLALTVSLSSGVVLASPIWLYQLWAFIAPGLHRHEKKYSLGFVAAGFPLFLTGSYFAYWSLPKMASVMLEFSIIGSDNQLPLDDLLNLIMRMIVVFGLSFELPLLLVMLNFGGVLSGKKMAGWWRGMILGITLFAAIATPSTDPISMLALAAPIWVLYFAATTIALVNDRRRTRREAMEPADDEASELDLTPEDIGEVETVSASRALPAQSTPPEAERDRINGYDDVT